MPKVAISHPFRRGAKQPLSSLNRTIGGHVAGYMPHEYTSNINNTNTNTNINDDETPRTARAFSNNAQMLPNITRDLKKRQRSSFDPTKKKHTLYHDKENIINGDQEQHSRRTTTRARTRTTTRKYTPPPQNKDRSSRHSMEQSHNNSSESKVSTTESEGKENFAAPVKRTGSRSRPDDCNPATPTRLYVSARELENSNKEEEDPTTPNHDHGLEDSVEFDQAPDIYSPPMTPPASAAESASPVRTTADQWGAREQGNHAEMDRHRCLNDLGIEFEGKYDEQNEQDARTAQRTDTRQPPVSPLRSPHPNKRHGSRGGRQKSSLSDEEGTNKESPEPETARAHQFVSNRSPAAAMARLRRMKQERTHVRPSTPLRNTNNEATENARRPRAPMVATAAAEAEDAQKFHEEHHHHHHHHHHHSKLEQKEQELEQEGKRNSDSDTAPPKPREGGFDIIFSRARHGRLDEVRTALDGGMNVNSRDIHGNTLLHIACQNGNKKLVKAMLRKHADINATNNNGNTSLHFCFMYAYYGMAEYIMSKGADDTVRNNSNQTPYDVDR